MPERPRSPRGQGPTQPPDNPIPPPQQLPSGDYSYTVELVARIENQLGGLTEAIKSIKETTKEHGVELRAIGKDVYAARTVTIFVGAFLTLVIAVVGYVAIPLLFKLIDIGADILKKGH
jgi:hypothetical protein